MLLLLIPLAATGKSDGEAEPIDREALVRRHQIVLQRYRQTEALQVGNGELAFAVDQTGLQTFDPQLGTYSQWGWHTFPKPEGVEYEQTLGQVTFHGHQASYASVRGRDRTAYNYFRSNPHRLHLGRIGFEFTDADGQPAMGIGATKQTLDLWQGRITSEFTLDGQPVKVVTCAHPERDAIAVRVESPLLAEGRIKIFWHFPYPGMHSSFKDHGLDWDRDNAHQTETLFATPGRVDLKRTLDEDIYFASIKWPDESATWSRTGPHRFVLSAAEGVNELEFTALFAPDRPENLPDFRAALDAGAAWWKGFWTEGGAIDLSESTDPRWQELERRIVLSQYVTAVNSAGSSPPQETGLYRNSWYGKFHLEMITWHGVHFALWNRQHLLKRWMEWMRTQGIEGARQRARQQGYQGARWNKMIDRQTKWESPSTSGPFRITQQGHAIYMAELLYRLEPTPKTLEKYRDVVLESAEFMADFLAWDEDSKRYVLGPPLKTGVEISNPHTAQNPTVELSYWAYGLETAQKWRERLGLERKPEWDQRLKHLSMPPVHNGVYINIESEPEQWAGRPAWLEAYGCMPGVRIDPKIMDATYQRISNEYSHFAGAVWGVDFSMFAMTAARLGKPQEAVDWLLRRDSRNTYLANGANFTIRAQYSPYYPANGGLLWAVAMMAAGWDGAPDRHAPGFPADGSWVVRYEQLRPAP